MKHGLLRFQTDKAILLLIRSGSLAALAVALITSCFSPSTEFVDEIKSDDRSFEVVESVTPFATSDDIREDVVTLIDFETAKKLALETAKSHPAIDFPPDYVSLAHLEHPYFEDYYFVYVWGLWHHDVNSPFAVSQRGDVFKLPEEFSQLAQHRGLALANSQDAQALLEFYLEFDIVWPGFDEHIILEEISAVPEIHKDVVHRFLTVVNPLEISSHHSGWTFEFFTWRAVGGVLFHWKVVISHAGEIEVSYREQLETGIGQYILIE